MSTVEGYHEYTGGCYVHRGVIMSTVGDTMSTLGDVQYTGGYHEYCTPGAYHDECGGIS